MLIGQKKNNIGNTITFVYADDWTGLYVDGRLQREGHSIEAWDALVLIQDLELDNFGLEYFWCDLDWIHDRGNLPDELSDVKRSE